MSSAISTMAFATVPSSAIAPRSKLCGANARNIRTAAATRPPPPATLLVRSHSCWTSSTSPRNARDPLPLRREGEPRLQLCRFAICSFPKVRAPPLVQPDEELSKVKPDWAGEDATSQMVNVLINSPIYELLKPLARRTIFR